MLSCTSLCHHAVAPTWPTAERRKKKKRPVQIQLTVPKHKYDLILWMMSFSNYLNEDKMGLVVCVQYGVILSRGLPCTSIKPESSFLQMRSALNATAPAVTWTPGVVHQRSTLAPCTVLTHILPHSPDFT